MKVTEASGVLRKTNKIGKVINISSVLGSVTYTQSQGQGQGQGRFNAPLYRCSKAAQVLMTKNQNDEKNKMLQLSEEQAS